MKCEICGKSPQFGSAVSHSKRHTNRKWLPNTHTITLDIDNKRQKVNICTRCLRTQQKRAAKAH